MFRNLKRLSLLLLAATMLSVLIAQPAAALYTPSGAEQQACSGINLSSSGSCANASSGVNNLVSTIVGILSWIVGVVSIIMIIIGGFRLIIANGDSNAVASARTTIIYALVGLAVAALAQLLVHFVLGKTTSATATCSTNSSILASSPQCHH